MGERLLVLIATAGFCIFLPDARACGGYQFKLKYLRPCDNDTSGYVVTLEDVDPVLTQDCRIMSKGCVNITKEVNNVQVMYKFIRNNVILANGEKKNGCQVLQRPQFREVAEIFNMPTNCPVLPDRKCVDGKEMNVREHASKIGITQGEYSGFLRMFNENGTTYTCYEFAFNMMKVMDQVGVLPGN